MDKIINPSDVRQKLPLLLKIHTPHPLTHELCSLHASLHYFRTLLITAPAFDYLTSIST